MKVLVRLFAAMTILICIVLLLASVAGGVGVWLVKDRLTAKTTDVFQRVDGIFDLGDKGLGQVKTSLTNASDRLADVKEEQRKLALEPRKKSDATRTALARMVQRQIEVPLKDGHDVLRNIAEGAVVLKSILDDMGDLPFLEDAGLDSDKLTDINKSFTQVESSAWELSRLLGDPGGDDPLWQLSDIEKTLKKLQELIAEYEPRLRQTRGRLDLLRARILFWITPGTVLVSFVCFWIALSQISLLCHAWSWWSRASSGLQAPPRPTIMGGRS